MVGRGLCFVPAAPVRTGGRTTLGILASPAYRLTASAFGWHRRPAG
jgi:hypothetical protein